MPRGDWESLLGLIIGPALEAVAAALNERPGLVAQVSEHPFEDACVLWIGQREPASSFVSPHGSFAIHDEPVLPMIRVEEAEPTVADGRPVATLFLRRSEISIASIKAMALAFADRLPASADAPAEPADPQPIAVAAVEAAAGRGNWPTPAGSPDPPEAVEPRTG